MSSTPTRVDSGATAPVIVPETRVRLERAGDGQLWALGVPDRDEPVAVRVCRLFPWSQPGRWVSLRDGDDEEVELVRDAADLEDDSRVALEEALAEAGFVMEILSIESIEEEIEIRTFEVTTAQGQRTFQTARDEWPRQLEGGGLLLKDVAGDLYAVRDPKTLDDVSQRLLWVFID